MHIGNFFKKILATWEHTFTQKHARTHAHTHTHTHIQAYHTHTHARTHALTHAYTYRNGQAHGYRRNLADLPNNRKKTVLRVRKQRPSVFTVILTAFKIYLLGGSVD